MQQNAPAAVQNGDRALRFSTRQRPSALAVGTTGTLIFGLQPVPPGALLSENRVTFDGLALIATVEMLAIGIGSAFSRCCFQPGTCASHSMPEGAMALTAVRGINSHRNPVAGVGLLAISRRRGRAC